MHIRFCDIMTHLTNVVLARDMETIMSPRRAASRVFRARWREKENKVRAGRGRIWGEIQMALHKVNELGWVSFWVAFIIVLFAFFIPTVNRALNL